MEPKIGHYACVCCLMDLNKIEDEEWLEQIKECIEDGDGPPYQVFPTLEEAVRELRGELSPEDEARELERLGWVEDSA